MIKLVATIEGIRTLKDGSFKIEFETLELDAETGAELLQLRRKGGYLWFADYDTNDPIPPPEPPKEFKSQKSLSEQLRNVLYVYWETHKPTEDFETYRANYMRKLIDSIKEKLP